jgi:hypothetical protein
MAHLARRSVFVSKRTAPHSSAHVCLYALLFCLQDAAPPPDPPCASAVVGDTFVGQFTFRPQVGCDQVGGCACNATAPTAGSVGSCAITSIVGPRCAAGAPNCVASVFAFDCLTVYACTWLIPFPTTVIAGDCDKLCFNVIPVRRSAASQLQPIEQLPCCAWASHGWQQCGRDNTAIGGTHPEQFLRTVVVVCFTASGPVCVQPCVECRSSTTVHQGRPSRPFGKTLY